MVVAKRLPWLLVGWLWFAITIALVIGIIQISAFTPYIWLTAIIITFNRSCRYDGMGYPSFAEERRTKKDSIPSGNLKARHALISVTYC